MSDPILLRHFNPAVKGEEGFVLSTWLRDLHKADPSGLDPDLWFEAHAKYVKRLLVDPGCLVLMAVASDRPDEILGYVVARPERNLEWLYVRPGLREKGIARKLLNECRLPDPTPARWTTPSGRTRLRLLPRSRSLRSTSRRT